MTDAATDVAVGGTHDVIVVGGGPGGYAAALYGASAGLDVAVVEKHKVGGTCLHAGCIPAKELLEAASVYRTVSRAGEFGVAAGEPSLDWSAVLRRKQQVIDKMMSGLSSLLGQRKVTVYAGSGSLGGSGTVEVSDADESGRTATRTLSAGAIIVASGSVPRTIAGFDVDGELVVTSDELFKIGRLPESAAVVGGGAIGCEFASMLGDLGAKVTVLEALPSILAGCDREVANTVRRSFRKRGIDVHTDVAVHGHQPLPDRSGTVVSFGDGKQVGVEMVVVAVGRRPRTEALGLEDAGVETDERGFVTVDQRCRTTVAGVWAVGDVVNSPQLAHTAFAEGMLAVRDIKGEAVEPIDYSGTPWCIYSHPEVAFAGHTEQSAGDAGFEVVTSVHRFMANGRAQILGDTEGLVKVIAEKQPDGTGGRILGVHMAGPWVTEQLGQAYLAVNWEATVNEVAGLIQPHPTMSELFGETVMSLTGRSLHG
ncbi:MAG: dihydrolipoyl dehydrogenase [Acidimicrobiaceae bacterium]|nr:dihydrolipoyl dehydrogenase [Acidimicrobiaceae bacterium]MCY4175202.1 dihydrolipoyl dehydrogenase [Acidimicrobiaceae bacterium]MCY4280779.1 dihydrolipoyl dehydrogenase [Acidimicrobiaceae bacterium]MCY4293796.1 dihydrolipoyl dehydrogenase [Acidimicrobiaceae bacterium]